MILSSFSISYVMIALVILILLAWIIRLELKTTKILGGKSTKDLESLLLEIHKEAKESDVFQKEMRKYLVDVEKRIRRSLQIVETIRFDAFQGTGAGGSQSFATVYANEKGEGVVISSFSVRERTSLFSKPLKDWKSSQELSPEEKEVIEKAKQKLSA